MVLLSSCLGHAYDNSAHRQGLKLYTFDYDSFAILNGMRDENGEVSLTLP
jgi:hypothetical protein